MDAIAPLPMVLDMVLQLLQIAHAAVRRRIPAVEDGVDEDLGEPFLSGHVQQGKKMGELAVNAAIGNEPHEVQRPARAATDSMRVQAVRLSKKDRSSIALSMRIRS
jgi:hypothetical protein